MSKKLVVPTLETQQKYPLFYAEATKTINDIIEHISKERGIYTSNIEPDPKEHTIWFNTNFNAIYFYNEKTKSFIPITGGGGGDLSAIITLISDLREEIGDRDNWDNQKQYNTIYEALDGLQTQMQDINSTIIPIYTVSDKNELFGMNLSWGIYKIEEYDGDIKHGKNYYILSVSGRGANKKHTLYGNSSIYLQETIDGVKQFVKVDFDTTSIQEIIGSGKFGSNLEDASNITDAINILSSIIGETDSGDADLSFMNGYSILTYLNYLQTLVNNLKTLVGDGNFGPNFIDGDDITICLQELGRNVGYGDDWNNIHKDKNIIAALDRIDSVIKELNDKTKTDSSLINGGKITYSYKTGDQAMEHPIVKNLPAGRYNISINVSNITDVSIDPFGVGSIIIRNTNRKLLSYYPSNNIPLNLQFSEPVNIYVTPLDKDYLDYCITEYGGFQYEDASYVISDVDYTFDNIWVIPSTDVSDIKDRLDVIENTILSNSEFIEPTYNLDILIENNKKYKINNRRSGYIIKNENDIITNFTILSIYSDPPIFEGIPILGFSDTYTYEEVVLLEYNNGYITVSKILEKGDFLTFPDPITIFDPEMEDVASSESKQLGSFIVTNVEKTNVENPILYGGGSDVIVPPNYKFTNVPEGYHINNLILYGSYDEFDYVPYGDYMNSINNLIVYSSINIDDTRAYINRYIIGNGGIITGWRTFNTLQLSSFTMNDAENQKLIVSDNEVILTNCSANIDNYTIIMGFSSPKIVAYFGNNTNVGIVMMDSVESLTRIFENIPENLTISYNEYCYIELYTKQEHIEEFKNIIKTKYPNTNILNNISFRSTEFITRQNGLFKETVAINKGDEIAKYIHV